MGAEWKPSMMRLRYIRFRAWLECRLRRGNRWTIELANELSRMFKYYDEASVTIHPDGSKKLRVGPHVISADDMMIKADNDV